MEYKPGKMLKNCLRWLGWPYVENFLKWKSKKHYATVKRALSDNYQQHENFISQSNKFTWTGFH